jgi:hypothetical protein
MVSSDLNNQFLKSFGFVFSRLLEFFDAKGATMAKLAV